MHPDIRSASAAYASILLALAAIIGSAATVSRGELVGLVARSGYPPGVICVEQRTIIVRVDSGRKLHINSETLQRAQLINRLEEIFRPRAERVAYVLGAPDVSFGEVAEIVGLVRTVVPNVGLLTPSSTPTDLEPLISWRPGALTLSNKTIPHLPGPRIVSRSN
jgi:biopolymer transport protein ExbD